MLLSGIHKHQHNQLDFGSFLAILAATKLHLRANPDSNASPSTVVVWLDSSNVAWLEANCVTMKLI